MQIHKQLATRNDCYLRNQAELAKSPGSRDSRYAKYYQGPRGVMIHSTGANNPNLRRYVQPDDGTLGVNPNGNDWNRPGLDVAVHAFIGLTRSGEVAAYQILPWEYRAWHCGGSGNDTHLSFEICEDNLQDRGYFDRVYQMAMELTAELCRKFRLDPLTPGVVVDHAEGAALGIASNHADVDHWWSRFGTSMDDFRAGVAQLLQEESRPLYRVRKSWADKDSQIGAFADLDKAKAACPVGYSVFDPVGKEIYTNTGKDELEMQISKEDLRKMINDAATKAAKEAVMATVGKHYKRLGDVSEPSYRPMLDKLAAKGYLKGRSGTGADMVIDMYESDIRAQVIAGRALEAAGLLD